MQKQQFVKHFLLLSIILLSFMGTQVRAQQGTSQFFDNTLNYNTNYYKFTDWTCQTDSQDCSYIISVQLNTKTPHLTVLDAKDLFMRILVYKQDINSKIQAFNIADVYIEQVIDGGRYGGEAFDQSDAAIAVAQLPQITTKIPYDYHVGLDGCNLDACTAYREGSISLRDGTWFTHLQINIEIQLYIDIPNPQPGNTTPFRYQAYIYDPVNDQLSTPPNQASQSAAPGFEMLALVLGLVSISSLVILKRKFRK